MQSKQFMEYIVTRFQVPGKYVCHEEICSGIINRTYLVTMDLGDNQYHKYVFQKINTNVFREPYHVMENIMHVTEHIKKLLINQNGDYTRRVLSFALTHDGKPYFENEIDGFWRCYEYIDDAVAYNIAPDKDHIFEAGFAFGEFQYRLKDYDATTLYETIPNFHNTVSRMQALHQAIADNKAGRLHKIQPEIEFILEREAEAGAIVHALESGAIPYRVTHNDTKINNVLFDISSDKAICVIDLDTVMPGSSLYDFGDAIRSGSCAAAEDEQDLSKVFMDIEKYRLFTKGFIKGTHCELTETEIEMMPVSAKILTLELASRFLADYLNGDTYFHTDYDGQNLRRTRTQIKLVSDIESKLSQMEGFAQEYAEKYKAYFA